MASKNITISVDEYKDLLKKEMPSSNDKWLIQKLIDFLSMNMELNNDKLKFKSTYDLDTKLMSFIKAIDVDFYKKLLSAVYDNEIEEQSNKVKMEKLRALKEASKENE